MNENEPLFFQPQATDVMAPPEEAGTFQREPLWILEPATTSPRLKRVKRYARFEVPGGRDAPIIGKQWGWYSPPDEAGPRLLAPKELEDIDFVMKRRIWREQLTPDEVVSLTRMQRVQEPPLVQAGRRLGYAVSGAGGTIAKLAFRFVPGLDEAAKMQKQEMATDPDSVAFAEAINRLAGVPTDIAVIQGLFSGLAQFSELAQKVITKYPALREAAKTAGIPIERAIPFREIALRHPAIAATAIEAAKQAAKGIPVGLTYGGLRGVAEGLPPAETLKLMVGDAAWFAGFGAFFGAAATWDITRIPRLQSKFFESLNKFQRGQGDIVDVIARAEKIRVAMGADEPRMEWLAAFARTPKGAAWLRDHIRPQGTEADVVDLSRLLAAPEVAPPPRPGVAPIVPPVAPAPTQPPAAATPERVIPAPVEARAKFSVEIADLEAKIAAQKPALTPDLTEQRETLAPDAYFARLQETARGLGIEVIPPVVPPAPGTLAGRAFSIARQLKLFERPEAADAAIASLEKAVETGEPPIGLPEPIQATVAEVWPTWTPEERREFTTSAKDAWVRFRQEEADRLRAEPGLFPAEVPTEVPTPYRFDTEQRADAFARDFEGRFPGVVGRVVEVTPDEYEVSFYGEPKAVAQAEAEAFEALPEEELEREPTDAELAEAEQWLARHPLEARPTPRARVAKPPVAGVPAITPEVEEIEELSAAANDVLRRGGALLDKYGINYTVTIGGDPVPLDPNDPDDLKHIRTQHSEEEIEDARRKGDKFEGEAYTDRYFDSEGRFERASIVIADGAQPLAIAEEIAHTAEAAGLLEGWVGEGPIAEEQHAKYLARILVEGREATLPEFARPPTALPATPLTAPPERAFAIRRRPTYEQKRAELQEQLAAIEQLGTTASREALDKAIEATRKAGQITVEPPRALVEEFAKAPPAEQMRRVARLGKAATAAMRQAAKKMRLTLRLMADFREKVRARPDWLELSAGITQAQREMLNELAKTPIPYRPGTKAEGGTSLGAEIAEALEGKPKSVRRYFHELKVGELSTAEPIDEVRDRLFPELTDSEVLAQIIALAEGERSRDFASQLEQAATQEEPPPPDAPEGAKGFYEETRDAYAELETAAREAADAIETDYVKILLGKVNLPAANLLAAEIEARAAKLEQISAELDPATRRIAGKLRRKAEKQIEQLAAKEMAAGIRASAKFLDISPQALTTIVKRAAARERLGEVVEPAEFKAIIDEVNMIRAEKAQEAEDHQEVLNAALERIRAGAPPPGVSETGGILERPSRWLAAFGRLHLNLEKTLRQLDLQTPDIVDGRLVAGPLTTELMIPYRRARSKMIEEIYRQKQAFVAAVEEAGMTPAQRRAFTDEAAGPTNSMPIETRSGKHFLLTPDHLAYVILGSGDPDVRAGFLNAHGTPVERVQRGRIMRRKLRRQPRILEMKEPITEEDLEDIIAAAPPESHIVAEAARKLLASPEVFDATNEVSIRVFGYPRLPEERRGNYAPKVTPKVFLARDVQRVDKPYDPKARPESAGFLQEREDEPGAPVVFVSLVNLVERYIRDAARFRHLTEPIRNMFSYMNEPEFQLAILQLYGEAKLNEMLIMLDRYAAYNYRPDYLERGLGRLVRNLARGKVALSYKTLLSQYTSYLGALMYLNPETVFSTRALSPEQKRESIEFVKQHSAELEDRYRNAGMDRDAKFSSSDGEVWWAGGSAEGQYRVWALMKADRDNVLRVVTAVRAAYPEATPEDQAFLAEMIVRDTQGVGDADQRAYLGGKPGAGWRAVTMWTSWSENSAPLPYLFGRERLHNEYGGATRLKLARQIFGWTLMASTATAILWAIKQGWNKYWGKKPKKGQPSAFVQLVVSIANDYLGQFYGLREISWATSRWATGRQPPQVRMSPIEDTFNDILGAAAGGWKALASAVEGRVGRRGEPVWNKEAMKALKKGSIAISELKGIPGFRGGWRIYEEYQDILNSRLEE